jgi:hypothetical protein
VCAVGFVGGLIREKAVCLMATSIPRKSLAALGVSLSLLALTTGSTAAAEPTVGLGVVASYAVIAGTTVTNTGPSTVHGDLGVSPGTAVTGFPPGIVSNGSIHSADANALSAQAAVTTAFNDAAGRSSTGAISADLAGQTLIPGVYTGGALALSGVLTLDAQGDPTAVFVFQAASTLVTASGSRVSLINGAGSCNVFWQVGSSATIGTSSVFVGTVLALTSISAQTNASIEGRLLARNGAVTLDSNTFTRPFCQSVQTTTTAAGAATTAVGGTASTVVGGAATTAVATASSVVGGSTTPVTIPGTGGHAEASMAVAIAAVLVGGTALLVARRPMRAR